MSPMAQMERRFHKQPEIATVWLACAGEAGATECCVKAATREPTSPTPSLVADFTQHSTAACGRRASHSAAAARI
jgi:hypothetical protein